MKTIKRWLAVSVSVSVVSMIAAPSASASWGWTGTLYEIYMPPDGSIVVTFTSGYTTQGTESSPCSQPGTFTIPGTDKNNYALILAAFAAGKTVRAINDTLPTAPCGANGYPVLGRVLVWSY